GQHDRPDRLAGIPRLIELLGADDALVRHDLAVDATHAHLGAIGAAPHPAVGAADAQINLTDRKRPAPLDAQPALEQLRPGVGGKDQLARRVEAARHHDLAVADCRHFQLSAVVHHRPPFGVALRLGFLTLAFSSSSNSSRRWKLPSQNRRYVWSHSLASASG